MVGERLQAQAPVADGEDFLQRPYTSGDGLIWSSQPGRDLFAAHLHQAGAGEVGVRIDAPVTNHLVRFEPPVRLLNDLLRLDPVMQQEYRVQLGRFTAIDADSDGVADTSNAFQRSLDVVWMDVEAVAGDDHLLLSAQEVQPTLSILPGKVPGVQPPSTKRIGVGLPVVEIATGDICAPNQDLPVISQLDGFMRQRPSDRSEATAEWIVQADNRSSFGQAIALDDQTPGIAPESLVVRGKGCATHQQDAKLFA